SASSTLNGGGGLLLVGTMYFHDCPESLTGPCSATNDYQSVLSLQGNAGTSTQIVGDIITDQLALGGNSTISMELSPYSTLSFLRAGLVQ
ncbi:MAG TPA: hypothetical protein VKU44_08630, partial [Terriglobia bacterium]|nr:hypothetical protein [Terriglobia bacterium]